MRSNRLRDAAVALGMTLLLLSLFEVGLRSLSNREPGDDRNSAVNADDGDYWYYETVMKDGRNIANSWGFLGPEPARDAATAGRSVLVIGDSIPASALLDDSFVGRAAKAHPDLVFLNAALKGYSLEQIKLLYEKRLEGLRPALVILVFYIDDVNRELRYVDANRMYNPLFPLEVQRAIASCRTCRLLFTALAIPRRPLLSTRSRSYEDRFSRALEVVSEIEAIASSRGARLAVFNVPRFNWRGALASEDAYAHEHLNQKLEAHAGRLGLSYYDLTSDLVGQEIGELRISSSDIHFNARGHEFVAELFGDFVASLEATSEARPPAAERAAMEAHESAGESPGGGPVPLAR